MIEKPTLNFLEELTENNNREWFQNHKSDYLKAKANFEAFIEQFLELLTDEYPEFGFLTPKDCVFRIYRDLRFSKDKTPYKNHFAAGISRGGKRVHVPGWHIHISPGGNSYFGGGLWHPDKASLAKVRQEIDYNFEEFQAILRTLEASRAFQPMTDKDSLIRPPKGYDKDNPAIKYLKMKNFVIGSARLKDKQVLDKEFLMQFKNGTEALKPFLSFLEKALFQKD